jgi:membrane carboxypeptidase/penicillin-binding protein
LPIWLEFMGKSLQGKEEADWTPPPGICNVRVDSRTGHRISEELPGSIVVPVICGKEPERANIAGGPSITDAISSGGI